MRTSSNLRLLALASLLSSCSQSPSTDAAPDAGVASARAVTAPASGARPTAAPAGGSAAVDATLARVAKTPHLRAHPTGATLLKQTDAGFETTAPLAGGLAAELPREARGEVRLRVREGRVTVRPEGLSGGAGALRGDAIVWADAAPAVDLVQVVDGATVEELRVLREPTTTYTARWRVRVDEGALTLRARERRLELVDGKGRVALGTAPIVAVDAQGRRIEAAVSVEADADGNMATATFTLADAKFPVVVDPGWSTVPMPGSSHQLHTATLMAGPGKVLVAGGKKDASTTAVAETYDVAAKRWESTDALAVARQQHAAVALDGQRVLVAGGQRPVTGPGGTVTFEDLSSVELYDAATATFGTRWTTLPPMNDPRKGHVLLKLKGGEVLAAGGFVGGGPKQSAEIFAKGPVSTPASWTSSTMVSERGYAAGVALPDGRALVIGGFGAFGNPLSSAEMFSPSTGTWSPVLAMKTPRALHSATLLPDGRVLVVGGATDATNPKGNVSTAEIYDPSTGTWTSAGSLSQGRAEHGVAFFGTSAADGKVLVAGGHGLLGLVDRQTFSSAELFDVATMTWSKTSSMTAVRLEMTVTATSDTGASSALVVGGDTALAKVTAELYTLPKLGDACTAVPTDACAPYVCVDGICCDKPCSGTCESCLASKKGSGTDGTCGPIKDGTDPDAECGPTCTGTTQTNRTCNGASACRVKDTPSCATGYACAGNTCATSCASTSDCAATHFCVGTTCVAKRALGAACADRGQCASGSCADGVCCDKACSGTCESCLASKKGSGTDGTCAAIKDGTDPDAECAKASCSGLVSTKAQRCNGAGACRSDGTVDCAATGYACDPTSGTCLTGCAADKDCAPTSWCSAGKCAPKAALGAACSGNVQCTSGFCADGVCCDKACTGGCEACTAKLKSGGADGTCGPVPADTNEKKACVADVGYPASCKQDGLCDGKGACRAYAKDTTECGATTCDATSNVVKGLLCNGGGACLATTGKGCAPYRCGTTACKTACAGDGDCVTEAFCNGSGACALKRSNGDACAAAKECTSGFCADGVCCNTACSGQCEACDGVAKGTCAPVVGAPRGARPACNGTDATCKGSCDGKVASVCTYPTASKDCGSTCAGGKSESRKCDGAGACTAVSGSCSGYACQDGASCKTACSAAADCLDGYACKDGKCVPATASCSEDGATSYDAKGEPTACGAYRCEQATGRCFGDCSTTVACAPGYVCDGARRVCIEPPSGGDGGCATTPGGRGPSLGALALGLALVAARRRRLRA